MEMCFYSDGTLNVALVLELIANILLVRKEKISPLNYLLPNFPNDQRGKRRSFYFNSFHLIKSLFIQSSMLVSCCRGARQPGGCCWWGGAGGGRGE